MADVEVLIVGAGPTGLVLALWLTKLGLSVRIIDKSLGPGTTSRALGVQPRTLELYRQLDLADTVVRSGHPVPAFNVWTQGKRRGRIPLSSTLAPLTPYPFLLIYPQDEHERLLADRLTEAGVVIERETELADFTQNESGVTAVLRRAGHPDETITAAYLAGCDGARSKVREKLGIGFPGGTYDRFFYVADIHADGAAIDGEIHVNLDTAADFLAIFPMADHGRARLVGTVLDDRPERRETLTFEDVSASAIKRLKIDVKAVNWFSTYRVHHRVADRFRDRRAFLLGDAGHIHSPAGGQGMNTGIGDAINLAWKLAAVIGGRANDALLDTYEAERIGFARRLVATTDRVFTLATSDNPLAQFFRSQIAPWLLPLISRIPAVGRFNFRTISQIALNYRRSALSRGKAGGVRGGDRLPWVRTGSQDNCESMSVMTWQVHVYGAANVALSTWCDRHSVPFHVFNWTTDHGRARLARNAAYLIRPDAYVALADPLGLPTEFERYFVAYALKETISG